jgi:hypothetical protein
MANRPSFEVHERQFDPLTGEGGVAIWVPSPGLWFRRAALMQFAALSRSTSVVAPHPAHVELLLQPPIATLEVMGLWHESHSRLDRPDCR